MSKVNDNHSKEMFDKWVHCMDRFYVWKPK